MFMAVTVMTALFAQEKRYGFESAILKKKTVFDAKGIISTASTTQYIADFGRKEYNEISVMNNGVTVFSFRIKKDGYSYSWSTLENEGSKVKMTDTGNIDELNFLNLTDEDKKKYQIEEGENVQFLEKDCKSYEMTFTALGQTAKATVLVWLGVTLKSTAIFGGNVIVQEVTEILEGVEITEEKFELPEGINFIEYNQPSFQQGKELVSKGTTAPDFTLSDLAGESVTLSSLKGKYIVLDFWGSWCGPCMRGMPEMKKYYEKHKDILEFVGIACGDKDAFWRETVEKKELNWIQLKNNDDTTENVSNLYGISSYPTKIILDKDLIIIEVFQGEVKEFYTRLDQLLD